MIANGDAAHAGGCVYAPCKCCCNPLNQGIAWVLLTCTPFASSFCKPASRLRNPASSLRNPDSNVAASTPMSAAWQEEVGGRGCHQHKAGTTYQPDSTHRHRTDMPRLVTHPPPLSSQPSLSPSRPAPPPYLQLTSMHCRYSISPPAPHFAPFLPCLSFLPNFDANLKQPFAFLSLQNQLTSSTHLAAFSAFISTPMPPL